MTKDRLRKSTRSFASHIDLEKEEQLREIKTEIEDNVKKALKLIKNEDLEDKCNSKTAAGESKKEFLAELIKGLHQKYESLYAHYDHLIGELKKSVHAKRDKESSSSSSSDSDSDSSKDRGSRNGKLKNGFKKTSYSFKQELEMANAENAELRKKLTNATSQNEALSVKYQMALSKLQEEEENVKNIRNYAQSVDSENSRLVIENKDLLEKLDVAAKVEAELKQRLELTQREKDNLTMEKETALHRIEQEEKSLDDLKVSISRFKDENAFLRQELQAVTEEVFHLNELLESAQSDKRDTEGHIKNRAAQAENLTKENQDLQKRIYELEIALKKREAKTIEQEKVLVEKDVECLALGKLDQEGMEAFAQITHLMTQVNGLKEELDSLQVWKHQMDQQFEIEKKKFTESLNTTENEKMELKNNLAEKETLLKQHEDAREKLMQENEQIEASLQVCQVGLRNAEKKMGQMAEQFHKKSGCKDSMVIYLEDIIEDLKRDLELKKDEVRTLLENGSTTEIKLRLSKQKVRYAEQLLNRKEERFRELEARYRQEVTVLEERIAELCLSLDSHQNMIRDISEYANNNLATQETVVEKFVEKCENHENYILEVSKELQIAKNYFTKTSNEKEKLRQAVNQLTVQLGNEKEQQLVLKKQTEKLQAMYASEEGEMENLAKVNNQLEKKIEDMERNILCLGEEKREAIRQLCMWVDYHQSRYNRLKEIMSRVILRDHRTA